MYKNLYLTYLLSIFVIVGVVLAGCMSTTDNSVNNDIVTHESRNGTVDDEKTITLSFDNTCYIIDPEVDEVVEKSKITILGTIDEVKRFDGTMKIEGYEVEGTRLIQTEIANHPDLWSIYMKYTPSLSDEKGIQYSKYAYALFAQELKAEELLVQIRPLDRSTSFADYNNCMYAVCAENEEEAKLQYQRLIVELEDALALYGT